MAWRVAGSEQQFTLTRVKMGKASPRFHLPRDAARGAKQAVQKIGQDEPQTSQPSLAHSMVINSPISVSLKAASEKCALVSTREIDSRKSRQMSNGLARSGKATANPWKAA